MTDPTRAHNVALIAHDDLFRDPQNSDVSGGADPPGARAKPFALVVWALHIGGEDGSILMLFARLIFASLLSLGAFVAFPAAAHGQSAHRIAQGDTTSRAALVAERQRVRGELERANAEVDALKRSGRGLREDYRLRERLADAEALARRLTELDARLGASAAPMSTSRGPGTEPRASAADGPAELEAKADILADQAQRLATRGDALLGRARDLRARQTLRRRVGQMERDPFSPLEGSKRRAMTGSVSVAGATTSVGTPGRIVPPPPVQPDKPGDTGNGTTIPTTTQTSPGGALGPAVTAVGPPGASNPTPSTSVGTGSAISSPTLAPAPTSGSDATALSVQLRDLLDPTTLAEIQHLEAAGGAGTSFEALERAGAALKARAERLRQQSAALRASEHEPPRAR
jgi:hypothetical protein